MQGEFYGCILYLFPFNFCLIFTAMLKIGVSACFMYPDESRIVHGPKQLCYLENDMAIYLYRKHVLPVLIPDLSDDNLFEFMDEMDGLLLSGGMDVAPETYNEKPIENGKWPGDAHRDVHELKLMEYMLKSGKPILGICRGLQIMNVFFGGSLYQDIATQRPNSLTHRDAGIYDKIKHGITFKKNGWLDRIYGKDHPSCVNSVHHQAVKDAGKDLTVEAWCTEDEIVESLNWQGVDDGSVMAIQWHPEFSHTLEKEIIPADPVYDHFLKCCEK